MAKRPFRLGALLLVKNGGGSSGGSPTSPHVT
jgi:hypothetical protein